MLLDDVSAYLASNGITDIYKSKMPDEPDSAVCLYEYGGFGPRIAHDGIAWRNPAIQVVVRDKSYQTARNQIHSIYFLLFDLLNTEIGATRVLHATPIQEPFNLGAEDSRGRIRLVCNFDMAIQ
jgi:Bacteriophage minor capsid protein